MPTKTKTEVRPIRTIAAEIDRLWEKVNYAARPYLDAMYSLDKITDAYGMDSGIMVVLYFLSNARSFTGPDARRIKKELNAMCK